MRIGSREFDVWNQTYVMGILNVTPDSFSDGGKWNSMDRALKHVEDMLAEGMDILDIGGESTRPGSDYSMPEQEEMERVPSSLHSSYTAPLLCSKSRLCWPCPPGTVYRSDPLFPPPCCPGAER